MRNTRGQASLEFLMTYGWALLVIGVVMVVLWQWGLFTPQGTTKQTYMGFWGLMPVDYSYRTDGTLNISFQNNIIDGSINVTQINVTAEGIPTTDSTSPSLHQWVTPGGRFSWKGVVSGSAGAGNAYNIFLAVAYWDNRTGPTRIFRSSGTIQGSVESI